MRISPSKISEIADKLDIVEIVSRYVQLEKRGDRFWGRCPFHNERTPSFSVTPDKNLFYCFGCQKGGDIFSFIQEIEHISFLEAVESMAKQAHVEIPKSFDTGQDRKRAALSELYNKVGNAFHYILSNSEEAQIARDYVKKRNIYNSIDNFLIGYAPSDRQWLFRFLRKKSYSVEFLQDSGLFSKRDPRKSLFSERVMFPIRNRKGDIIAFGGRRLREGKRIPKYINSPETPLYNKSDVLYGLYENIQEIRKNDYFILVEGYLDVIATRQAGIPFGLAPLGTAFTEQQAHLIARYAKSGILLFDGDEAGFKATEKAILTAMNSGIETMVAELPSDSDPADIVQKDGPEALKKLLKYPINSIEYLLNKYIREYGVDSPEKKYSVSSLMMPFLQSIESSVKREGYVSLIADKIGIDNAALLDDLGKAKGRLRGPKSVDTEPKNREQRTIDTKLSFDLYLMLAVIVNREFFVYVRNYIDIQDLEDERAKHIYLALEDCYRNEENGFQAVLQRIENQELKKQISVKAASDEFNLNPEKLIKDATREIRRRKLKREIERIMKEIRKMEKSGDNALGVKDLQLDLVHYTQEIEKLRDNAHDGN